MRGYANKDVEDEFDISDGLLVVLQIHYGVEVDYERETRDDPSSYDETTDMGSVEYEAEWWDTNTGKRLDDYKPTEYEMALVDERARDVARQNDTEAVEYDEL